MRTVAILMFSLFITLNANSALALTCKSGSADCSSSSASDCTALGYANTDTANCKHYLYCPFNTAYKACIAVTDSSTGTDCSDYPLTECPEHGVCSKCPADETYKKLTGCETGYTLNASGECVQNTVSCPDGYSADIKSVADCGNGLIGDKGWTFSSSNGCGKCTERSCSGNANYTSIETCGNNTAAGGWKYSSCYYGDELRGTCTPKSCEDYSGAGDSYFSYKNNDICKTEQFYLGDYPETCYTCQPCAWFDGNFTSQSISSCYQWCEPLAGMLTSPTIYAVNQPVDMASYGYEGTCYTASPDTNGTCCCTPSGAEAMGVCL